MSICFPAAQLSKMVVLKLITVDYSQANVSVYDAFWNVPLTIPYYKSIRAVNQLLFNVQRQPAEHML
jgi:hypothetical protein